MPCALIAALNRIQVKDMTVQLLDFVRIVTYDMMVEKDLQHGGSRAEARWKKGQQSFHSSDWLDQCQSLLENPIEYFGTTRTKSKIGEAWK